MAAVLFIPLFVFRGLGPVDFWWWMSLNILLVVGLSIALDKGYFAFLAADLRSDLLKKILWGSLSGAILYLIFLVGNFISRDLFPFAGQGIADVYAFKKGISLFRSGILLFFLIGPGEELFWRGYLQRRWQKSWGLPWGLIAATAFYTLIHVGSGNIMLILAAAVCGLYWGGIFALSRSLLVVVVSHALWDILIFILLPLG